MQKTTFHISQMDCPSEENLIRIKLDEVSGIEHLDFNIPSRELYVYHNGNDGEIDSKVQELNLGGKQITSEFVESLDFDVNDGQSQLLWTVLIINFSFFLIEVIAGYFSTSMGLVADSLDMLADSFVYGISLFAVGKEIATKKRIAKLAGYFQLALAVLGFSEVMRRSFGISESPDFLVMIVVSVFALIANGICLYLLQKSKGKNEAHMKASMIFTSNDIIINLGVIVAGFLVLLLNSVIPDLVIGGIVFVLVVQGAIRILKLG